MSKFREGNCIEVVIEPVDGNENIKVGDTGQVVEIIEGYVGVEFDRDISGHDCEGMGKKGHCHYFDERTELDYLKLIYDMDLVDELLDRMDEEFKVNRAEILSLPPERILTEAATYHAKQDIMWYAEEVFDLEDDEEKEAHLPLNYVKSLLKKSRPLEEVNTRLFVFGAKPRFSDEDMQFAFCLASGRL